MGIYNQVLAWHSALRLRQPIDDIPLSANLLFRQFHVSHGIIQRLVFLAVRVIFRPGSFVRWIDKCIYSDSITSNIRTYKLAYNRLLLRVFSRHLFNLVAGTFWHFIITGGPNGIVGNVFNDTSKNRSFHAARYEGRVIEYLAVATTTSRTRMN